MNTNNGPYTRHRNSSNNNNTSNNNTTRSNVHQQQQQQQNDTVSKNNTNSQTTSTSTSRQFQRHNKKRNKATSTIYTLIRYLIVCIIIIIFIIGLLLIYWIPLSSSSTGTNTNTIANGNTSSLLIGLTDDEIAQSNTKTNTNISSHTDSGGGFQKKLFKMKDKLLLSSTSIVAKRLLKNVLYSSTHTQRNRTSSNNNKENENSPRIAMIIPYSSGHFNDEDDDDIDVDVDVDHKDRNTQQQKQKQNSKKKHTLIGEIFPSYMLSFCYGAESVIDTIDFFIFFIGTKTTIQYYWPNLLLQCPSNVIFIPLSTIKMASLFSKVVLDKYNTTSTTTTTGNNVTNDNTTNTTTTEPAMTYNELVHIIKQYIQINPYGLVEFKPAYGYIFSDYIQQYSHWGYTDLDILFSSDMNRWITTDELYEHDIVTYTFGDQQRLYLRGQYTVHKNKPNSINILWKNCSYLYNMDTRFYNMLKNKQRYRVESAEGCYSTTIFHHTNISVKFAVKAWTDVQATDTVYSHGLYISRTMDTKHHLFSISDTIPTVHQVIYKVNPLAQLVPQSSTSSSYTHTFPGLRHENIEMSYTNTPEWFTNTKSMYYNHSIPLQHQYGELIPIPEEDTYIHNHSNDDDTSKVIHCMHWVKEQYQQRLCLKPGSVDTTQTVYWKNGQLYKQNYENSMEIQSLRQITTGPFFHFQEWKRSYRYNQLATLYPTTYTYDDDKYIHDNDHLSTFVLTVDGAIPFPDSDASFVHMKKKWTMTKTKTSPSWGKLSPLGLLDMTVWNGMNEIDNILYRELLPGHTYCLYSTHSKSSNGQLITKCKRSISWYNTKHVRIILGGNGWKHDSRYSQKHNNAVDVTLVLTLQIIQIDSAGIIQDMINHLCISLRRWQGQPAVVIVYVAGVRSTMTIDLIENKLSFGTEVFHESTLLAVIYEEAFSLDDTIDDEEDSHEQHLKDEQQQQQQHKGVSRKALLNMAIDAVPTRWYVSGIKLESGLSISIDTAHFVHQVATSYNTGHGHIFWIPQWGLEDEEPQQHQENANEQNQLHTDITIHELLQAKQQDLIKSLFKFNDGFFCNQDNIDDNDHSHKLDLLEDEWWKATTKLITNYSTTEAVIVPNDILIENVEKLDTISQSILELLVGSTLDSNTKNQKEHNMFTKLRSIYDMPILLIDNHGPYTGIRTNEILREVEELFGGQCYSALRLLQLSILGYHTDILPGAFALSSSISRRSFDMNNNRQRQQQRKASSSSSNEGDESNKNNEEETTEVLNDNNAIVCHHHCSLSKSSLISNIVSSELRRVVKTAIIWAEAAGDKSILSATL